MTKKKRQSVRQSRRTPQSDEARTQEEAPLSPHRAFVVQFRASPATAPKSFTGRVEHIVSGHTARFHSPEELLTFFTRILVNVHELEE